MRKSIGLAVILITFASIVLFVYGMDASALDQSYASPKVQVQPINLSAAGSAHNSFQNNTNACATCHQTHSGEGSSLLAANGIYATCISCHDGTLGVYNVFTASTAGTFGSSPGGNASMHLSNGSMQIKAAPGGINGGSFSDDQIGKKGGNWTADFNCASCHSPHGSYSDRLLNYNPNNMGNTSWKNGGRKAEFVPVLNFRSTKLASKFKDSREPQGYPYILLRGTKADLGLAAGKIGQKDTVVALYKWIDDKGSYQRSKNPWLYGVDFAGEKRYWTQLYKTEKPDYSRTSAGIFKNIVSYEDKDVHFSFNEGYAYTSGRKLDGVVRADIAQAYVVKLDKVPIGSFGKTPIYAISQSALHQGPVDPKGSAKDDPAVEKAMHNGKLVAVGLGEAMSNFCAACHSDYLAHTGKQMAVFNKSAFRHSTDNDQYNCVRCHFSHGTDISIMRDSKGLTISDMIRKNHWTEKKAKAYLLDENPDSALKRYTNMAVCFACHASAATGQIFNNPDIQDVQLDHMPDLVPFSEM